MTRALRWGFASALIAAGIGSLYFWPLEQKAVADRLLSSSALHKDAPARIVFMGTSLTAGNPWPEAVTTQLEICLKRPMQNFRIAQGGATSVWGLAQVDRVVAKAPYLILLEFAINDADVRRGLSLQDSRDTHRSLILRLQQGVPDAQIILLTMNPATGLRRLLRPRLAAYYALYSDLAETHNIGLIDLYPRWQRRATLAQDLIDGVHPQPDSASAVIVPVVTKYLADLWSDCKSG